MGRVKALSGARREQGSLRRSLLLSPACLRICSSAQRHRMSKQAAKSLRLATGRPRFLSMPLPQMNSIPPNRTDAISAFQLTSRQAFDNLTDSFSSLCMTNPFDARPFRTPDPEYRDSYLRMAPFVPFAPTATKRRPVRHRGAKPKGGVRL